jgi:AcrR family transcriptional regulator
MSSAIETRSSGGGKRARTQAALAAAALEVVAEKGFGGASLDEIAARAGMTKGAIYSNFRSKAELLLAAITAKGLTMTPTRPPGVTLREHLADMAHELAEMLERARSDARFLAEFQLYAIGDPEVREALAVVYAETFAGNARFLAGLPDLKPGVSPQRLAVALQSLSIGFLVQSFLSPESVSEAVIHDAFQALAEGTAGPQPAAATSSSSVGKSV